MQISRFMSEQPKAIVDGYAAAAGFLAGWRVEGAERVLLVGSGSSLHAAAFAAPIMADCYGGDVDVLGPIEFLSRPVPQRPEATLVIVTSQTGTSTTSVEALQRAAGIGARVLLVTAAQDAPAARLGHSTILLPIGEEPIGPKTKGFVASCAALIATAARMGAQVPPPEALVPSFQSAVDSAASLAESLVAELDDVDYVLIAGNGTNSGVALEASLKLAEIAGVPTAAFTLEEAMHGRLHGLTARSLCVLVVSDKAARRQAAIAEKVMGALGVRVMTVDAGTSAGLVGPWRTLSAIFMFQYLAVAMCRRRGGDPDLMRYPGLTAKLAIKLDDGP